MANRSNHSPRGSSLDRRSFVRKLVAAATLVLSLAAFSVAQEPDKGKVIGGYITEQSLEVGGRIADTFGNTGMYNTFVNLESGARLLDYTLSMRSLTRESLVFDDLYFSNAGYGGDPQNFSRLRISKNRLYNFTASFRRDVNYFNDSYLANPYNTPAAQGGRVVFNDSPHLYNTRRRMGDFNLTLAPQSPVRVRLGYSRNDHQGPSFSTFHEGTDIQVFQDFANRQDQYQVGIDIRVLPRTSFSFDQFFVHNKVNTNWSDVNVGQYTSNGLPVDLGAIYNTYYGQPCSNVVGGPIVNGTVVKPNCQVYAGYSRTSPTVTDIPTSQLSFSSKYWHKLDITGSATYSWAESTSDYNELARTYVSRTAENGFSFSGPITVERIASSADLGVTYHINDQWSITDEVRWIHYRIPGYFQQSDTACIVSNPLLGVTSPPGATPGAPAGSVCLPNLPVAAGLPAYSASSPADRAQENIVRFLGDETISNTTKLAWEPNRHFGTHVGYKWANRTLNFKDLTSGTLTYYSTNGAPRGACPADAESCTATFTGGNTNTVQFANDARFQEDVTEHAFLFGITARPVNDWRINADLEWMSATGTFTPISPRNQQRFKLRSGYRVANWGSISGSINLIENRNNNRAPGFREGTTAVPHKDHFRAYSLTFNVTPSKWAGLDLGWSYSDVYSNSSACLPMSGNATSFIPEGGALTLRCVGGSNGAIPAVLLYQQSTHDVFANLRLTPIKRVTFNVGYDITSDSGNNTWLRADTLAPFRVPVDANNNVIIVGNNPAPGPFVAFVNGPNPGAGQGPLAINWHRPSGSVEIELTRTVSFKGAYNYYGYNEKSSNPGFVTPRDFHANVGTLSLKYAF